MKWFKIKGKTHDPRFVNTVLCVTTYSIMILYTILICRDLTYAPIDSSIGEMSLSNKILSDLLQISKCFFDSLVPTTLTFVFGILVQNFATMIAESLDECGYTLWLLAFYMLYLLGCIIMYGGNWLIITIVITVVTVILVVFSMKSINQIQEKIEEKDDENNKRTIVN